MSEKTSKLILPIVLTTLLFVGGLGLALYSLPVIATFLLLILILLFKRRAIILPRGFYPYLIFLFFSALSLFWSVDKKESLRFLFIFISSGLFWILAFNYKKELYAHFEKLLVFLGLAYGLLFFVLVVTGTPIPGWGIYSFTSHYQNHNHIGDLWGVVLLVPVYNLLRKRKNFPNLLLLGTGLFFLLISLSRSAYLSFAVALTFLLIRLGILPKFRRVFIFAVIISVALFIYASLVKPTFETRIYFIQALLGFRYYPFGVGLGNFSVISKMFEGPIFGLASYSIYVHNIALEAISGLGILGLSFVFWLFSAVEDVFKSSKQNIIFASVFIFLLVNFLFDRTYVVPSMLWLWFMALGLAQKSNA